jgi:nitroimidazol reductase NimA-like FMN-containing flavoprotein (pyridoxamine 5'-phosphate oxidase superfamily)
VVMDERTPDSSAPVGAIRIPRIRALSVLQSRFILTRNHVGRLAFVSDGRLELLPIHYVFANGSIIGRTSTSVGGTSWAGNSEVVFEVDEPDRLFEWRSVIVRGVLRKLAPPLVSEDRPAYWSAVSAFQALVPDAFTERDPTPFRRALFTIDPSEITGREASMSFVSPARRNSQERSHGDHI